MIFLSPVFLQSCLPARCQYHQHFNHFTSSFFCENILLGAFLLKLLSTHSLLLFFGKLARKMQNCKILVKLTNQEGKNYIKLRSTYSVYAHRSRKCKKILMT